MRRRIAAGMLSAVLIMSMSFGSVTYTKADHSIILGEQKTEIQNKAAVNVGSLDEALTYVTGNSPTSGILGVEVTKLALPVLEGYTVEVCADYEQIIARDGVIYRPLTDKTVKLLYKVSDETGKKESQEYTVTVKGSYTDNGVNVKPNVIPQLADWHGDSGEFQLGATPSIIYQDDKYGDVAEIFKQDLFEVTGVTAEVKKQAVAKEGDFIIQGLEGVNGLGKEGYELHIGAQVIIKANQETGAFYGTRSILQILQQTEGTLKKGVARDYPKYQVRGFMLDLARKQIQFDTVQQIGKALSWYKMNDYQLHLNDNYAKMEKHLTNQSSTNQSEIEAIMDEVYSAFRLESKKPGVTSTDTFYTKSEFSSYIDEAKTYGLTIVPEIDVPGHSLAFLKNNKDLYYKGEIKADPWGTVAPYADRIAMFDVTNPKAVEYIKSLFSEYVDGGAQSVFRDSVVHVGGDEFYGDASAYRTYIDDLLRFISVDKNRTARVWGSLTAKAGTSKVYSKNIQMNIWNYDWAHYDQMLKEGYSLINTSSSEMYIVPGGNWFQDYIDSKYIYENFQPNRFVKGNNSQVAGVVPAGNEQMLGAAFALWNDSIDLAANGVNEYEISKRILTGLPALAEKFWGEGDDMAFAEFEAVAEKVADIPGINLYHEIDSKTSKVAEFLFDEGDGKDTSGNAYNALNQGNNITFIQGQNQEKVLQLAGGSSYLSLPLKNLGPNNKLKMRVMRSLESTNEEQILLESAQGSVKAVQKETGKVGYSREGYDYSFNYELPKGVWVDLEIRCDDMAVSLFVNGSRVDQKPILQTQSNFKTTRPVHNTDATRFEDYPTLVLPLERIGSTTKAFKGMIDSVKIYKGNDANQYITTIVEAEDAVLNPGLGTSQSTEFITENEPNSNNGSHIKTSKIGATLTLTFTGTGIEFFTKKGSGAGKIGVTIDGVPYEDIDEYTSGAASFKTSVFLQQDISDENQEHTIVLTTKAGERSNFNFDYLKVYKLEEVAPPVIETFAVELPTGEGYTVKAVNNSSSPVDKNHSFSFQVTIDDGYEGPIVVKANEITLSAVDGVYTITNIIQNQTITVEGVHKRQVPEPKKNGWLQEDDKLRYYVEDVMSTGWKTIDSSRYYFGAAGDGNMATDWRDIEGSRYYFGAAGDGKMATGWRDIEGNRYYFGAAGDGKMATGWKQVGNSWYYFGGSEDGKMATGWKKIGSIWYYFGGAEDGKMATGWKKIGGSWYYFGGINDGKMTTGWKKIGSSWYYFGGSNDGKMATGWKKIGSIWYYFGGTGDGKMATGWKKISGNWYYFGGAGDGKMATGWKKIGSSWYYFGGTGDGKMATGWKKIGGNWYYLGGANDGKMATGWIKVNGKEYYLYANGVMASATWIGRYYVDTSGTWTKTR